MPASRPVAVAVGYYRFTDIFFEWHQALPNPQTVGPLKATIAYDALVHPDHPLRKAGVDGIELYIGTFPNGEARLLFSSAQIEYIRYWIHAVGLAEELIPLPGGDWLIQQNDMLSCSPAVYNDPAVLKKAIKTIDKNNKRLKGSEPLLTSRRLGFERVRAYWAAKAGTWIAIDIEAWDRDHTVLTEFGWSLIRWENGEEISEAGHLTVEEHRSYYNTFVAHNREHYSFGESEEVDKKTFKKRIRDLIGDNRSKGPLFLIFHDANQDVKYLRSSAIEAPITNLTYILPDTTPSDGLYVVDTADMFAALEGESGGNKRGLERICRHLQIPVDYLHNAGNDAYFTMVALKSMASGDPIDVQREKRWPNHASATEPKVVFQPWEEDSDFSDMEGVVPNSGNIRMIDPANDKEWPSD